MPINKAYHITLLGDAALLVAFSNEIDLSINKRVLNLFRQVKNLQLSYIKDVVPGYASLAVHYDLYEILALKKTETAFQYMSDLMEEIIDNPDAQTETNGRLIQIPVCYAPPYALDLADIAAQKRLSIEEVIHLHASTIYTVYMIGFLPGFPYMGKVNDRIAMPRRTQPRQCIKAGSVGLAGEQTGIYPVDSPGGWQIIGRTPWTIFQKEATNAVLLHPGDQVQFIPITSHEFENY